MKVLLLMVCCLAIVLGQVSAQSNQTKKMKILIHVTQGTENPTVAALAFLVARTAIEEGYTVNLFLAGDGVSLVRDQVLDTFRA